MSSTYAAERAHLAARLDELRAAGKRIVFTNGCFDLLHVGHVRLLQQASTLGDVLVVGVNSDRSVRSLGKGQERPIVGEADRAEIIASLECVTFVLVFDEDTPVETIQALRPHVHVKGGDYQADQLVEAPAVQAGGGRIHIFPLIAGRSTTRLVKRMMAVEGDCTLEGGDTTPRAPGLPSATGSPAPTS